MARISIALAGLAGVMVAPAHSQSTATPSENLDCAAWAAAIAGTSEDPEVVQGFGFALTWFTGLYEGATTQEIDEPLQRRVGELDDAVMQSIGERCLPRMQAFGARFTTLGKQMQQADE